MQCLKENIDDKEDIDSEIVKIIKSLYFAIQN